jgi:ABC-type lipoprotein release transport system permease subunit
MTFTRAWLRLELIRHWRSLGVLALLIALAGTVVLAGVAGARREASAISRLQAQVKPSQIAVYSNSSTIDWDTVRNFPEVEALSTFLLDYTYGFVGLPDDVAGFPPTDAETLHSMETPVVYSGRMWNPNRADEAVVTPMFVDKYHKGVGDTVVLALPTPQELRDGGGSGPNGAYTGPHPVIRIVGVVTSAFFSDEPGGPGFIEVSPGVAAKYRANMVGPDNSSNLFNYESAIVRLRGGEAAIPAFQRRLTATFPHEKVEIDDNLDLFREAQRHVRFDARCLLAFAGAAFIAALFLVGQAVARYASVTSAELRVLRATGMTPRQSVSAAATGLIVVGVLGALLSVVGAYFASALFPLGNIKILEPDPGRATDWTVFLLGVAVIVLLVTVGALASAASALRAARRDTTTRRSAVALAAARMGAPVPVLVGARFALEPGTGAAAVPVRPALAGAVAGVLGILAAFTFSHGVSDSVDNPERFGQVVALEGFVGVEGQDFIPAQKIADAARSVSSVIGVNDSRQGIAVRSGSRATVVLYTYDDGPRALPIVLLNGRLPAAPNEVALAPTTLEQLHVSVGERIALTGDTGPRTLLVTGTSLMPAGPRNGYADGGWVLPATYDAMFTSFRFHLVQVALKPGTDRDRASRAITAAIAQQVPRAAGYGLRPPDTPTEVYEIRDVRWLPIALGGFLGLLAIAAVGHSVATAVRRRAREVAILRALGMTRGQSRTVVVTQASLLAVVGLVFGIPLGLALGRTVWRAVAHSTPIVYVAPTDVLALVLLIPAALLAANLLAAWPARRAARMRIADVLRAE